MHPSHPAHYNISRTRIRTRCYESMNALCICATFLILKAAFFHASSASPRATRTITTTDVYERMDWMEQAMNVPSPCCHSLLCRSSSPRIHFPESPWLRTRRPPPRSRCPCLPLHLQTPPPPPKPPTICSGRREAPPPCPRSKSICAWPSHERHRIPKAPLCFSA